MSSNGSDSDGAQPRAHEAVDRKIKYTLDTFERINVHEHNVEFKFKDGAVKLSYDEALTEGTKSARLLQFWLATPYLTDTERARLADSEHQPAVQSMAVALQVLTETQIQEAARAFDVSVDVVRTGGRLTAPAKWKIVLHCIREAAGAGAKLVAALDSQTVERLFRRVAWKPVMQQLAEAIYAKPSAVEQSPQEVSRAADPARGAAHACANRKENMKQLSDASPVRTGDDSGMTMMTPDKEWRRCIGKLRN